MFRLFVFGFILQTAIAVSGLQLGSRYTFTYNTTVLVSELHSSSGAAVKDVGYQLLAHLSCSVLWQDPRADSHILLVELSSPQLYVRSRRAPSPDGFVQHDSQLDLAAGVQLLMQLSTGDVAGRVWQPPGQLRQFSGLLHGAASLLQFSTGKQQTVERDPSGECDVTYTWPDENTLLKLKTNCKSGRPQYTVDSKPLEVGVVSEREVVYRLSREHAAPLIQWASSRELHQMSPAVRPRFGSQVLSLQHLQLTDHGSSEERLVAGDVSADDAVRQISAALNWQQAVRLQDVTDTDQLLPQGCWSDDSCIGLQQLVSTVLQTAVVAELSAARAYVVLVPRFRRASAAELTALVHNPDNLIYILQLLDVLAAAQTEDAHRAAKSIINWQTRENIVREERYLVALSVVPHPTLVVIKDMVQESRRTHSSSDLHESILLTAAAIAKTYCSQPTRQKQFCQDVTDVMVKRMSSCTEEECLRQYLRALRNLASSGSVPALMKQVEGGSRACCAEALRALSTLPSDVTVRIRPQLEAVFYQKHKRYDSTSRTLAAELLLVTARTTDEQLQLLYQLGDRSQAELNSYLLKLLTSSRDEQLQRALAKLLRDTRIGNYDVMALGALSSVLRRQLFSSGDISGGFTSQLQMLSRRAMKQCQFSAELQHTDNHTANLLTFSIFTGGLTGLLGSPDPDDDLVANARLQLQLLGRQLRPLQLFSSQAELMGLIWSGAGGEKTSALQGSVLMLDDRRQISLQNGLSADLSTLGVASFDFSGLVEVSLWNRNAHVLVDNKGAMLLRGRMSVNTPFVSAQVVTTLATEALIESNTDVEAYDGFHMCARIAQAPMVLREVVRKLERVAGSKHRLRRVRRTTHFRPAVTYNLNHKNSVNCDRMFGPTRQS